MPFVGAALQHGVGNETAGLAIFGVEVMGNHAVFLDRVRRNRSVRSTLAAGRSADRHSTLALLIVIDAFHHEVPATGSSSIYSRSAERPVDLLWHSSRHQVDEVIRVASLERHLLPNPPIDQLRDCRLFRL